MRRGIIPAATALLATISMMAQTPQLRKNTVKEVVAAMTLEEKVQLVVGTSRTFPVTSEAAPGTIVRPMPDYSIILEMLSEENSRPVGAVTLFSQGRVKGAGGETASFERLGITPLVVADGPAGLRIDPTRPEDEKTYYCTAFPTGAVLASSWDTELVQKVTAAMGDEVREYGVDVLLAPAMNIQRNPLCGRNFEYFSEDPLLSGKIAAAYIRGVQSNGVGTSIKHFAANNQEKYRNGIDVHVSERALREIYLKGFEIAVKEAAPWTVMSSYNKVNGVYASENRWLLTDILRGDWGFDGLVMTDWWAEENGARQVGAGNDLLMPGSEHQYEEILSAVRSGRMDERLLDLAVEHILGVVVRTPSFSQEAYSNAPDLAAHADLVRESVPEGMVLLENDGVLPLGKRIKKVALFGNSSYDLLVGGSGSGNVNRAYKVSIDEGLSSAGYKLYSPLVQEYMTYLEEQKAGLQESFWTVPVIPERVISRSEAEETAQKNDIAILTIGRMAGEGVDRTVEKGDWLLSDTEDTNLKTICEAFHNRGKKVVVLLNMGNVVEMVSWKDLPDAILHCWLPGQEGGNAIADVLSGKASPSGKLPMTIAKAYEDYPSASDFPSSNGNPSEVCYDEDIYVGYRYFDAFGEDPLYPFGYGLSYTSFTFGDLQVTPSGDGFDVSVTVKNTGKKAGKEIVQIYVTAPASERYRKPAKELKAFGKTGILAPGASQTLTMHVAREQLASWSGLDGGWVVDPGTYEFIAAASSRDVRLKAEVSVAAEAQDGDQF